jgi:type VI secretion system protein ImpK
VDAPYRPGYTPVPLWVIASAALLLLLLAWGTAWWWLGTRADSVDLAALEPRALPALTPIPVPVVRPPEPPPPPPPPPRLPDTLAFLQPQIDLGNVAVAYPAGGVQLSLFDLGQAGLFESGSAQLRTGLADTLRRIGEGLNDQPGQVVVSGHTDNQPILGWNLRFRSNLELSLARAAAAAAVLRAALHDPARVTTQGFGAQYPLNGNATPEERARNRRIEIILRRPAQGEPESCTDCSHRCTAAGC